MSVVTSTRLATVLETSMDGTALNFAEERVLFNPDPECNSLLECLFALFRDFDVPAERQVELVEHLSEVQRLNAEERARHLAVSGELDVATAALHNTGQRSALPVKAYAEAARPALATLREAGADAAIASAAWTLASVFALAPEAPRRSLAGELGRGPFAQLEQLHAAWTSASSSEPAAVGSFDQTNPQSRSC